MADHDTHDHTGVPGVGGLSNPMSAEDDLIIGGASGSPTRLAKGADGQRLTVDPSTHHLVWADPSEVLEIVDIPTAETDTTKVLAPDGAGGVEFRAEAGGSGGSSNEQAYDYPTSLSGDSSHFAATTGYSDVGTDAYGTLEILNSSILHTQVVGNKSSVLRRTLSTSLAGAFDVRTLMMLGGTYFSSNDQTTHTFALQTSGGLGVMRLQFRARVTGSEGAFFMGVYYNNGSTADVMLPWIKAGDAVTVRLTRDASNNLGWFVGLGERPMAMVPLLDTGRKRILGTSALQVDRIEYQTVTTGQDAGHVADMFVDYLQVV